MAFVEAQLANWYKLGRFGSFELSFESYPHALALAPAMLPYSYKFLRLLRDDIFLFFISHFGSCADIVDSPDVSLACTDYNYDLLLSETNYGYALCGCKR